MAAAEYFSNAPMGPTQSPSPYQRPQYAQTAAQFPQPQRPDIQHPQQPPPPPYQAVQQTHRPSVHFAENTQRPQRDSFSSHAPIPTLTELPAEDVKVRPNYSPQQAPVRTQSQQPSHPPPSQQQPQPQSSRQTAPYNPQFNATKPQPYPAEHASLHQPQRASVSAQRAPQNSQFLSPYLQPNQSQYSVNGYASDPEPHRRRRRRHSNDTRDSRRHDRESREERTRKERSRSTNADGFLGAAGGGLIGDLIFPGLGTVGGVVAGWIGGKDYGKHRKYREGKLDRDQEKWEQRFHRDSDEKSHHRNEREHRSYERHKHDY